VLEKAAGRRSDRRKYKNEPFGRRVEAELKRGRTAFGLGLPGKRRRGKEGLCLKKKGIATKGGSGGGKQERSLV